MLIPATPTTYVYKHETKKGWVTCTNAWMSHIGQTHHHSIAKWRKQAKNWPYPIKDLRKEA